MIFNFLFFLSTLSFADNTTTQIQYVLLPEDIRVGDSAQLISRGIPLGRISILKEALQFPPAETVLELFPQLMARDQTEIDYIANKVGSAKPVVSSMPSTEPGQQATPSKDSIMTAVESFDLKKFTQCLSRWDGVLKKIYSITIKAPEKLNLIEGLNFQVDKERGDGEKITQNGFLCGKFLGTLKLKKQPLEEELKITQAFLNLSDDQSRQRLFNTMVGAFNQELDFDAQIAGIFFWDTHSIKAAFLHKGETLPEVKELVNPLNRSVVTSVPAKGGELIKVTVRYDEAMSK